MRCYERSRSDDKRAGDSAANEIWLWLRGDLSMHILSIGAIIAKRALNRKNKDI
jgi:hypothetical protein